MSGGAAPPEAEPWLRAAKELLLRYPLCDSCLGRQFAALGRGVSNAERGRAIKLVLTMEAHRLCVEGDEGRGRELLEALARSGFEPAAEVFKALFGAEPAAKSECYVCGGIMERLREYADLVVRELRESGYEFSTVLVGCRLPPEVVAREDALRSEFGLRHAECVKREFNREVGKMVQAALSKGYDPERPDMVVVVDVAERRVELEPAPLFIYGRYRKLVRGIPQTRWRAEGAERFECSVEELVALPMLEAARGAGYKFHGAGREDVDVRTLGRGRPFVVEIKRPRVRSLDLEQLERAINERAAGKVEVMGLRLADRRTVREIKKMAEYSIKTYRALVRLGREVAEEDVRRLEEAFRGAVVSQRTPLRVAHRRADRVRKKVVYELRVTRFGGNEMELVVRCQGGLYVKELIHGDQGRTRPSVAEVLGCEAACVELDVMDIENVAAGEGRPSAQLRPQ